MATPRLISLEQARSILWGLGAFAIVLGIAMVNYQQGDLGKPPGDKPATASPKAQKVKGKSALAATYKECRPRRQKCVYLTFDDGPWELTEAFIKLLSAEEVPATFFVLGQNIDRFPKGTAALKASGQGVAVHTWGHEYLPSLSDEALLHTLTRTKRALKREFGVTATCYRPPYGATDKRVRALARSVGLSEKKWTVDPQDWRGGSAEVLAARVVRAAHPNAIILLHDGGGSRAETLEATKLIVKKLRRKGYGFRTLCRRADNS